MRMSWKESREWSWAKCLVWPLLSWNPWRTTWNLGIVPYKVAPEGFCNFPQSSPRSQDLETFFHLRNIWMDKFPSYKNSMTTIKTSTIFLVFHGLIVCAMFSCAPQIKKANRWNQLILSVPVTTAIVSSVPNSWSNSTWWNLENNFDKNAILVLDNYIQDDRLPRRSQYLL